VPLFRLHDAAFTETLFERLNMSDNENRKFEITDAKSGSAFPVRVTTRATEAEVVGVDDENILRVRLVASPAGEPAANQELIALLASFLEVDASKIEIVAGLEGREKLVSIEGVSVDDLEAKLNES
jgi:uncharacterized protein YggU (UPF0235/DUF167 family)